MPRKSKPKANWGFTGRWVSEQEPERIREASKVPSKIGLELSPELKKDFEYAIRMFIADKTQYADPPRPGNVRAALERVKESSEAFINALNEIDAASKWLMDGNGSPGYEDKVKVIRLSEAFRKAATLALGLAQK